MNVRTREVNARGLLFPIFRFQKADKQHYDAGRHYNMSDAGDSGNGKIGTATEIRSEHLQNASYVEHSDHKRQAYVVNDDCRSEKFKSLEVASAREQADQQEHDGAEHK